MLISFDTEAARLQTRIARAFYYLNFIEKVKGGVKSGWGVPLGAGV